MFHAPTTESKQQNDPSRKQPTAEHERILSPHVPAVAGQFGLGAGGSVPPGSPLSSQPQLARLHRTYGNQAVLRMLSRSTPSIQTKLKINQPGDQYEQEADRVSERVMCMPAPVPMSSSASDEIAQRKCNACAQEEEQHTVRRKCESCAEEDKKKKKEEETHEKLSRKESGGAAALDGTSAPAIVAKVLQSSGQPLDAATRAFFEPRFGHDFSRVRVHMDAQASASARAIHAQAYTVGQDMVFREGAFSCGAAEGRRLLAHELT